ncbi:hypothetical protein NEMIN01_0240 [Nematocida minor]|uniref:uncharacterized protein n=1 Tax=Nematocida minor TaxID=1912983 RepID=UPI002220DB73|nr:uncharacterized protein NEMIN01_0240 [Nematocida minor]KAI5188976.1 hypothetical protein NEMIN01_0240 [Nematocida minor]
MDTDRVQKRKEGRKENKRGEAAQEEKKEKKKPFTVRDFIISKYGVPLLKKLEEPFQRKNKRHLEGGDMHALHRYMRALVRLYTTWSQSSPLCGNKRNRPYTLLKEIEVAIKTQKEQPSEESKKLETDKPSASVPEEKKTAGRYSESVDSLFENTLYDTQSFSLMGMSQTDTDAQQLNLESMSDISEISEESSADITATRKRARKTDR